MQIQAMINLSTKQRT